MVQRFDGRHVALIGDDLKFRKRVGRQCQQQLETAEVEASADNLDIGTIFCETGVRNSLVAELRIKRVAKKEEAGVRCKRPPAERYFYNINGRTGIEIRNDLHVD